MDRRAFLQQCAAGSLCSLSGIPFAVKAANGAAAGQTSTVSFVTGSDRRQMVRDVLAPLVAQIGAGIEGKRIIVKPNFVYSAHPLCATHVDAVRGLLDVLRELTAQPIIIGESNASADVTRCFTEYGYTALPGEYDNVELQDLNTSQTVPVDGFSRKDGTAASIGVLDPFLDAGTYVISICRPKTHNCAVATLTLKNHVMAAPLLVSGNNQKAAMHSGGYTPAESPVLANNIFHLANRTLPSLAIVDGYEGMEGDGPIGEPSWGDTVSPVAHRIALAGTDPVAVDAVGFALMGIRPEHTYYVYLCGAAGLGNYSLSNIAILGPDITSHIIPYRMHRTFDEQIAWIPTAVAARSSPAVQGISPFLGAERTDRRAGRVLFTFALPYNTEARLSVCTLHARQVREIAWPHYAPGRYSLWWDGRDDYGSPVATGNYMAVLKTGTGTAHHPVVWRRP